MNYDNTKSEISIPVEEIEITQYLRYLEKNTSIPQDKLSKLAELIESYEDLKYSEGFDSGTANEQEHQFSSE